MKGMKDSPSFNFLVNVDTGHWYRRHNGGRYGDHWKIVINKLTYDYVAEWCTGYGGPLSDRNRSAICKVSFST